MLRAIFINHYWKVETMYTTQNFKSGAAVKRAIKAGERVEVFQPGGIFESQTNGIVTIEGPHYPKPHSWYLRAQIENSVIVKILK